jgi:hypothetical protein
MNSQADHMETLFNHEGWQVSRATAAVVYWTISMQKGDRSYLRLESR